VRRKASLHVDSSRNDEFIACVPESRRAMAERQAQVDASHPGTGRMMRGSERSQAIVPPASERGRNVRPRRPGKTEASGSAGDRQGALRNAEVARAQDAVPKPVCRRSPVMRLAPSPRNAAPVL